eukprot:CAMPEP_0194484164 /NCGR_PEP_ID=MMETSP0253-20130528/5558_1 /TAXON_ID=2966 /ORGANISM="Noctiluca scintillans" /LENGTH=146 /DNA_ID=CAMNT_0039323923 /DNA_START=298 /DNA_END=738 /DNA_ORIENTATION=-
MFGTWLFETAVTVYVEVSDWTCSSSLTSFECAVDRLEDLSCSLIQQVIWAYLLFVIWSYAEGLDGRWQLPALMKTIKSQESRRGRIVKEVADPYERIMHSEGIITENYGPYGTAGYNGTVPPSGLGDSSKIFGWRHDLEHPAVCKA